MGGIRNRDKKMVGCERNKTKEEEKGRKELKTLRERQQEVFQFL